MTDGELLGVFAGGDQKAFAELVRRHADWVWGSALRQAGDGALAEDIAQGTFLLLAQKAASLKDRASVEGWLFRVVQFLSRDATKVANRRKYHETRVAAMNREQAPESPGWDAIQGVLDEAVGKLREQDRQTILLRFYRGMSVVEVAGAMQVSEEAAGKRVSRAVDRLRESLGQQGLNTSAQVQELLASGMVCAAPAALVAQLSAGGGSAAGTALAVKAAKLLVAAKMKLAAAVVGMAIVAAGVTGGIAMIIRPGNVDGVKPVVIAPVPSFAAHKPEAIVAAPPVRQEKMIVAVCSATLVLPQNAVDELVAATQLLRSDPGIQTRMADAALVRPILRDLMPLNKEGGSSVVWSESRGMSGFQDNQQLRFGIAPDTFFVDLRSNIAVSAGTVTQIAGGYQLTQASPKSVVFAPITFQPGRTLVQIVPLVSNQLRRNLVIVYEAVGVDAADMKGLRMQTSATDWFTKPMGEHLRIARAGAVWDAQVSDVSQSARRMKAKKLFGGAEVWVREIHDGAVHAVATWTTDGRPAGLVAGLVGGAAKPTAELGIFDPNLPSQISPGEVWCTSIPLAREAGGGYACTIGYGDGPYKTVAKMAPVKGATAKVGTCIVEIERIDERGGNFKVDGQVESDLDVDIVAVRKDGTSVRNQHWRTRWWTEGQEPEIVRSFSYDLPPAEIAAIEVRTRPVKWVSFEGLAKRPSVPLPSGLEPPVERDQEKRKTLAAATPADRKAFLDSVQCMRLWNESSKNGKRDQWLWKDGRYRVEFWSGANHTLELGDGITAWQYNFMTSAWSSSKKGPSEDHDFGMMVRQIGGMEAVIALGDTLGKEAVHGVPCTVRSARMESTDAKVWLDSLGILHRLDYSFKTGPETVIMDYNPAGSASVWTVPDAASRQPSTR